MRITVRKLHRWLSITVAAQIIIWMASGLFFSILPITEIRGEHLVKPPLAADVVLSQATLTPAQASTALQQHFTDNLVVTDLQLLVQDQQPWYRISFMHHDSSQRRLINAVSGELQDLLSTEEAMQRAQDRMIPDAAVTDVQYIVTAQTGSEYRGRPLPLYRVDFNHASGVRLYMDAWTGEVLATRTSYWRVFDFLWMLHIMDYSARDDFSHWLLRIVAALALLTAMAGVVLWLVSNRRIRRGRSSRY